MLLCMKKLILMTTLLFLLITFFQEDAELMTSKLDVSITKSKLKGAVSGRKKITSLLLVSLFCFVLSFQMKF